MGKIEELQIAEIGETVTTKLGVLKVCKTPHNFKCESCFFWVEKCTAPKCRNRAICFATERLDNESVYFVKTKQK